MVGRFRGLDELFGENIAKFYNQWYIENSYEDKLEKDLIIELIKPEENESVLDIGCGCAWHLKWFKELGLKIKGIDKSPFMVKEANKFLGEDIVETQDASSLKFADNSFDITTLITVLEFIHNPEKVLKEAMRVARKKVFVGVLNKFSWLGMKRKIEVLWKKNSLYKKAKFFSVKELLNMINKLKKDDTEIVWKTVIPHPPKRNKWGVFIGVGIIKG